MVTEFSRVVDKSAARNPTSVAWLPRKIIRLMLAWLLSICLLPLAAFAQDDSAADVINHFQATLIDTMKDAKTLGYQGRYDKLAPAVQTSHDLAGIAKFAVGRYWDKLTDAQKTALVDTFSKLSIATYAYRFDGFSGEVFTPISAEQLANGDMLVRTQLAEGGGGEVHHFDYTMHQIDGHWRIINVIADGVSDLAIKRSEYTSIMRTQGLDALLGKLKAQIDLYSKPA